MCGTLPRSAPLRFRTLVASGPWGKALARSMSTHYAPPRRGRAARLDEAANGDTRTGEADDAARLVRPRTRRWQEA